MDAPAPPTEPLPVDVLLEIVARSDVTTAVRCAATGSLLRNAILDPGFRARLGDLRAEPASSSLGRRFDPARLLGVSYASHDYGGVGAVHLRPPRRVELDAARLLRWPFEPVSSRDGLLVLRREAPPGAELHVANAVTGHVTRLPRADVLDGPDVYRPALLAVDAAGGSFDLLAVDVLGRAQVFSSRVAAWGAARAVAAPPGRGRWGRMKPHGSPAVLGRTAYWLCYSWPEQRCLTGDGDPFVLAVHADSSSQAAAVELPEGCGGVRAGGAETCGLATTADGRLGLVVAEPLAVVMWALSSSAAPQEEASWSRQVVVDRRRIAEQVAPGEAAAARHRVVIQGFGERSGAVLLRVDTVGLVLLNLETEEAVLLRPCSRRDTRAPQLPQAWLHEVDLASLLLDMEIF